MESYNLHFMILVLFIEFQMISSNPIANPQGDNGSADPQTTSYEDYEEIVFENPEGCHAEVNPGQFGKC